MYYKGKKRRHSRYWWRRIRSRKYRPLLIKKTIQFVIVTIAICLLAILTGGRYGLYCLIWFFIAGIIIVSLRLNLRAEESLGRSQKQQDSKAVLKPQGINVASQHNPQKSNHRINEIPSEKSKTRSQKTSST